MCLQHSAEHARPSLPGHPPTVVDRMAWTIEHSVVSVSATSATTVAAFAANMASSITPVRLFGLFMVILVAVNFFFVLTLLLAFLALRERSPARAAAAAAAAAEALELVPLTRAGTAIITPRPRPPGVRREPVATALTLSHPSEHPQSPSHHLRPTRIPPVYLSGNMDEGTSLFAVPMASFREHSISTPDASPLTTPRSLGDQLTSPSPLPAPSAASPGTTNGTNALARQRTFTDSIVDCVFHTGQKDSARMGAGSAPTRIHAFLGGTYARMVHDARRWILLFAVIGVAFFTWRASMLELPHSRPTVWRRGSNIHQYFDLVPFPASRTCARRMPMPHVYDSVLPRP